MPKTRIYSKRLYVVAIPQGISGFRKPAIPAVVTGLVKRRDLLENWCGDRLGNLSALEWRIQDGCLPEHQQRMSFDAACQWLQENPTQAIYPIC